MPNTGVFKEAFLHYIWQYQFFDKKDLVVTSGEPLQIIAPGHRNTDAGPDFYNCKIRFQKIDWHGTVEIHSRSSDWQRHKHSENKCYNNVVLHVVWEDDLPIVREDGTRIPTLALRPRVSSTILQGYQSLVESTFVIPCGEALTTTEPFYRIAMLERCLIEKLEQRAFRILELFHGTQQDWEATAYAWLAKCYGMNVNSDPFVQLARTLPYALLKKYQTSLPQTEALLFGMAGFLETDSQEPYFLERKKEFAFLSQKHGLGLPIERSNWKFMRMRPSNFPPIRLAQFAVLLFNAHPLFNFVYDEPGKGIDQYLRIFQSIPNPFWKDHFHFGNKTTKTGSGKMGHQSAVNIVINGILPLRFAYAQWNGKTEWKEECLDLYKQLDAEENHVLKRMASLGVTFAHAYDTQAYLHLYTAYCQQKKCLSCQIGHRLLSSSLR